MGNLKVNTAICDMLSATPEILSKYDSIKINTALLIVSKLSKQYLADKSIKINMAQMLELEEACEVCTVNGGMVMGSGSSIPEKPTLLVVNGGLTVKPGSENVIKAYEKIMVNGSILLPESIPVTNIMINGGITRYPDNAVVVDELIINKNIIGTAKPGTVFYVTGMLKDLDCDPSKFLENNISIIASEVIVREEYEKVLSGIVSGNESWESIPDGFSYINGIELDDDIVHQHGGKLYITGDFFVSRENAHTMDALEALIIKGKAIIPDTYVDAFKKICVRTGKLVTYKGEAWNIPGGIETLSHELLQDMPEGVTIILNGGILKLECDITADDIRGKIHAIHCDDSILEIEDYHRIPLRKKIKGGCEISVRGEEDKDEEAGAEEDTVAGNETKINTSYYKF